MALSSPLLELLDTRGPLTARDLTAALGVSQPTLSRRIRSHSGQVRRVGRARHTRYYVPRALPEVGVDLPIYEVLPDGASRLLARLYAVRPEGYWLEAACDDVDGGYWDDLPWFLQDLRPMGFLGRLVPKRHADLDLPDDVRLWSADTCLRYLARRGWSLPGALVLGDEAFSHFTARALDASDRVAASARPERYAALADDVLSEGLPGSSAAGEQPKFLVRGDDDVERLVKFSPPTTDPVARRVADVLIAEHHALEVLRAHGQAAARSALRFHADRAFLEVERFDRVGRLGRRGLVSLMALDGAFGGPPGDWATAVDHLARARVVPAEAARRALWLQRFGELTANTDMHHGNLSFTMTGARVDALAPAYDMAPMAYLPRHHELVTPTLSLPTPVASEADVWREVLPAARALWAAVAGDDRVSDGFRAIAARHDRALAELAPVVALLPR